MMNTTVGDDDVERAAAALFGWVGEEVVSWARATEDVRGRYRDAVVMVMVCVLADAPGKTTKLSSRLAAHIERAARKAYRAGHFDGRRTASLSDLDARVREQCVGQRGVDAFVASLQHDADEATQATGGYLCGECGFTTSSADEMVTHDCPRIGTWSRPEGAPGNSGPRSR